MSIGVIGTGYVGLVTGACLAEIGNEVICIDSDPTKVKKLRRGIIPIYEPGLEEIVKRNAAAKKLVFSTQISQIVKSDIVFIAVGTPPSPTGAPDLSSVFQVASALGDVITKDTIVVNKSTVPVGTARQVERILIDSLKKRKRRIKVSVVSNPEFLKEGAAITDFMKPDRIVLGVNSKWAADRMHELYEPFVRNGHPILVMNRESSEMSKYASNAMLATKISFMNQIANLCELVGADVERVREAMSLDPRIGDKFLYAGVGYGGSCFPKDVQALIALANQLGSPAQLLDAVESVNNRQKMVLAKKLTRHFDGDLEGKLFAIWGGAFKPNTDDIREAPAISIIEFILGKGAKVIVYDPKAMGELRKVFGRRIRYASDMYAATENADALLLITEWSEFREPNFQKIKKLLKKPVLLDGRNIYSPQRLKRAGYEYYAIGR